MPFAKQPEGYNNLTVQQKRQGVLRVSAVIRIGSDGWRARAGEDLTRDNVVRIAAAAAEIWFQSCEYDTVYVAYDTREGASELARAAAETIAAYGMTVRLGSSYAPMPALSYAIAQDTRACGGLMVTGSHLPLDYLGIKFRMSDGSSASDDFNQEVQARIDPEPLNEAGSVDSFDYMAPYIDHMLSSVDGKAISDAHLKVVFDPMFGAAKGYMASVLKQLGVEVRELHATVATDDTDLRPEPIEPWVDDCEEAVVGGSAMAGFSCDGDADRIGAVDERGRFVSADIITALVLKHLVTDRGRSGRVVINLSSSVIIRRVAQALGCRVTVKPVGFKYIYNELRRGDVLIGGEETGGICIPEHLEERDALYIVLMLCELMAQTHKSLGELVDELEDMYGATAYARRDIRLEAEEIESLRLVLPGVNPDTVAGKTPKVVSHMDGLKLEFEDESWMLLRPSSTEPLVRLSVEANSVEDRDMLLEKGAALARGEQVS